MRLAADQDLASLARPRVPLALMAARQDRCLTPAFHSDAMLAVCKTCEPLADLPDRSQLAAVDQRIAGFFNRPLRQ